MDQDIQRAILRASARSYSPYSKYRVAAVLVLKDGSLIIGSNIENASYGLTVCAERVAVWKAVSEGKYSFTSLYVATPDGGMPCGACRQVLAEFCHDAFPVHIVNTTTWEVKTVLLEELLPKAFRLNGDFDAA